MDEESKSEMRAMIRTILLEIMGLSSLESLNFPVPAVPGDALSFFLDNAPPLFQNLHFTMTFVVEPSTIATLVAAMERRNNVRPFATLTFPCNGSTLLLLQNFAEKKVFLTQGPFFTLLIENGQWDEVMLPQILQSISHTKLSTVAFDTVRSEPVANQIMRFVSTCNLTHIRIMVEGTRGWTALLETKRSCLDAVRRNFKLRQVLIESSDDGVVFLDETEQGRVDFYMQRNQRLSDWVENPQSVPKHLWFYALRLAMGAGYTELYQSLLSISSEIDTASTSVRTPQKPQASETLSTPGPRRWRSNIV